VKAVAPLLEPTHQELWRRVSEWGQRVLRPKSEPANDGDARREARTILREIGEGGWLQALESQDLRALCLVRDAMAGESPLADAVVAIQALGATALILGGDTTLRQQWVPGIIAGDVMAAFAMTETDAGSDVAAMTTTARREGDCWVIDGEKHLISNAGIADVYLVFAKTTPGAGSRGISLFLVPSDTPGMSFEGAQVLAAAHPLGRIRFRNCRVPDSALVGQRDRGFKLGMQTLDRLRASVGAAACGMASRALEEAVAHARQRRQFGQLLSDMPVIRSKIGQMATDLDAARLLVYRAAWEQAHGMERISVSAAMAKLFATETAQRVVDEAVQIVGGAGVVIGHPVERLYRAVRALRIYEGASEIQRLIVAGGIFDEATRA